MQGERTASLLDAVVDNVGEGVAAVDREGRLRIANATARTLLGIDDGASGARLEDVAGDYRLVLAVRGCLERGTAVERELTGPGGSRVVRVRVVPLVNGGELPGGALLLIRDESRMRQLETVRRDFVANISHELRTPITAIQLLVETLQNGAVDDPPSAAQFVARIGAEMTHMSQMVAELLELGALESGSRPMQLLPVAPDELIGAAERLRPLAEERSLDLLFQVDPETPAVTGDAAHLGQVVRNLVHNAIKFTPPGGSVRVGIAPRRGGGVELRVTDTGCGLTEDEASRIFERFYKVDRSRQRDGEGTGLGLAIVRHVVEAHGGTVRVVSAPGRGSTFVVTLPSAEAGAPGQLG